MGVQVPILMCMLSTYLFCCFHFMLLYDIKYLFGMLTFYQQSLVQFHRLFYLLINFAESHYIALAVQEVTV